MLLLLAACARLHAPETAPPEASVDGAPSLAAGPGAVAAGRPDAEPPEAAASATTLATLDEAALAELLRNDGAGPLVVNFWATWCGPCVRELAVFREVAAEGGPARFALVSVDARRDRPRVGPFLTSLGLALPAYHLDTDDPSSVLSRAVPRWPDIIPVTLVLEPGGAERARFEGVLDAPALRDALSR